MGHQSNNSRTFQKNYRLTPHDFAILQELAHDCGLTVSALVNTILGAEARKHGYKWDGLLPDRGVNQFNRDDFEERMKKVSPPDIAS